MHVLDQGLASSETGVPDVMVISIVSIALMSQDATYQLVVIYIVMGIADNFEMKSLHL